MKKTTTYFTLIIFFITGALYAFDDVPVQRDNEHIKEILTNWDADKGAWLYESINALVLGTSFPERNDRVTQTTSELLNEISENRYNRIYRIASQELEQEQAERNTTKRNRRDTTAAPYYWEQWLLVLDRTSCELQHGRSNGDPHMQTFDKNRYDFQNAGDYVLTSSLASDFDVHTRQVRLNSSISVNGAVAINLNGDTVSVYAQGAPGTEEKNVLFLNGKQLVSPEKGMYFDRGGVMRFEKGRFVFNAPTGEQVHVKFRAFSAMDLLDIDVFVPACGEDFIGLLGDADGDPTNDIRTYERFLIDTLDRSDEAVFGAGRMDEDQQRSTREYQQFISHEFGNQFEVDSLYALFEEPWLNLSEQERYPSEHLSLAELSDDQVEEGLKICKKNNVAPGDLMGCVYDYGYVGLMPDLPADYSGNSGTRKPGNVVPDQTPNVNDPKKTNRPTIRTRNFPVFGIPPVRTSPTPTPNRTPTRTTTPTRTPTGR